MQLDSRQDIFFRTLFSFLALTSVAPLLAWVYDLGSFHQWLLYLSVPSFVLLVLLYSLFQSRNSDMREIIVIALYAGVLGTIFYDLFRVPFILSGGPQLLAPIESYGVLALDESYSTGLTSFTGWTYHFLNGIGFAVAYVAFFRGKHWLWGVGWALVLETATVVTPFADSYAIRGKIDVIAIAYAAHIPYGIAIGLAAYHFEKIYNGIMRFVRLPEIALISALLASLALLFHPWNIEPSVSLADADGKIENEKLHPSWYRISEGDCIVFHNKDSRSYDVGSKENRVKIDPDGVGELCFKNKGVIRLRTSGKPYDGGFLIVDD